MSSAGTCAPLDMLPLVVPLTDPLRLLLREPLSENPFCSLFHPFMVENEEATGIPERETESNKHRSIESSKTLRDTLIEFNCLAL